MFTAALLFFGIAAFCQQEENGTIYIKHPYIIVVENAVKDYTASNFNKLKMSFADTARYWQSGMEDFVPIGDILDRWKDDLNYFSDISLTPFGYPDYLHYKDADSKIVQSWWIWSAKSKKTGEVIKVRMVMFDEFNTAGKIKSQYIFGDFSNVTQARM